MKILDITCTEEFVVNPDYKGLRHARIEAIIEGGHYPTEVGSIRIWNNDELFNQTINLLEGLHVD